MIVVTEGRRPLRWACKQLSHLAKTCPQKMPKIPITITNNNAKQAISTILESGDHLDNQEKGWTKVIQKKEKINHNRTNNRNYSTISITLQKRKKKITTREQPEEMEINMKRQRDSRETQAKKLCIQPNPTTEKESPQQATSQITPQPSQSPSQPPTQQSTTQCPLSKQPSLKTNPTNSTSNKTIPI